MTSSGENRVQRSTDSSVGAHNRHTPNSNCGGQQPASQRRRGARIESMILGVQ